MSSSTNRPKKWLENRKHLGAYFADLDFADMLRQTTRRTETPPFGIPARPIPYFSFGNRIKHAWDVLRCKADALYWPEDFN